MAPFRIATMRRALRKGVGLGGMVWARGEPHWISDGTRDRSFVRAFAADACGLRTAAAFPVRIDGAFAAVVEFLFRRVVQPDRELNSQAGALADGLAAFIQEMGALYGLRAGEERFLFLAEHPEDLTHRWRFVPEPRWTYISPAVAGIFGYPQQAWYDDPGFMSRIVVEDDRPLLDHRFAHPEVTDPFVLRWRSALGDLVWTEQHTFPVYDDTDLILSLDGRTRIILPKVASGDAHDVPGSRHRE